MQENTRQPSRRGAILLGQKRLCGNPGSYYDGVAANGNLGDLKTAVVKDASGNALDTKYYRYYTAGQANGYPGGLKYVFGADSYARLAAAFADPTSATDAQ